ncbi:LPXTG-motif cell wall anchor domain-containing protein [Tangfeifania diversioriginum]|uniref:LPXTG-motif cell wall anchor domain-containing protein n=1 Tax=Tangfeifania diversioriginum TaxID=1168035 RepID=A0A1M6AE44_9BACT|nr:LPXTG cell wall anchor domain-containing protein [Tangfeifania diversioriginum]SHI34682.1 LPXTG-motif cell wall anchor domain-containing protein [Tangfeifania diversioriginum]
MEKIKKVIASLTGILLSIPYRLMAQDEGSYIENLGVQDSSYMEEGNPIPAGSAAEQASGSGNTVIIIVVAAVLVIAAVVFFILRKKKK